MSASGTNFLPWTAEEDAELVRLRSLGQSYAQCAEAIGTRTDKACACRAAYLAGKGAALLKRPAPNLWTEEEDAELRRLWPVLPIERISERLHRTVKGVHRRAGRLGLDCGTAREGGRRWTPEEDAVLRKSVEAMAYAEIGALLGRTEKSVKARALALQLKGGAKPRLPKPQGEKRKCHDCGRPTFDFRCEKCWEGVRKKCGCDW